MNSAVSEDEVINEDDPDDEIVTDEEIADHTYDPPLEPQVVEVETPSQEETIERVMTAPNLTEEELSSQLMPDRFKCDTCHIVVFSVSIFIKLVIIAPIVITVERLHVKQ